MPASSNFGGGLQPPSQGNNPFLFDSMNNEPPGFLAQNNAFLQRDPDSPRGHGGLFGNPGGARKPKINIGGGLERPSSRLSRLQNEAQALASAGINQQP